jgi:threonine/homoserine/homoserine lactone efflux protein
VSPVDQLLALVGFSFVSSVTPGPNNILLWASGAAFGFRRTVPHVIGTALGIGSMAIVVAAGLGVLITTIPEIGLAMKVAGSLYLLYLAYQIAGARALARPDVARPLGLFQAAAFQAINPKAWIFCLGAVTTFRPANLPSLPGTLLVAITMVIVVIPTAALWAGGGGVISRHVAGDRANRIVSLGLAGLLAATVVSVWI